MISDLKKMIEKEELKVPVVFRGMIGDWKALEWDFGNLNENFGGRKVDIRVGKKDKKGIKNAVNLKKKLFIRFFLTHHPLTLFC